MRTMLISRLNGVAWYHDAQTISQQCEMQVICLVERYLSVVLDQSDRPNPEGPARNASRSDAGRAFGI
jgi:hypothetical protein